MTGLSDPRHCGTLLFLSGLLRFLFFQCFNPSPPPSGRRRFMFSRAFIRGSLFNKAYHQQVGQYELLAITERVAKGYSFGFGIKNLQTSCVGSYFLCQGPNIPLLPPHAFQVSSNSYNHTVFGRMVKKKAPTDMKATGKHKDIRSRQARQSSYQYRIITRAVKAVAIIIGAVIGIALWAIARPILRGIGWLISILTAIGVIYWILTL